MWLLAALTLAPPTVRVLWRELWQKGQQVCKPSGWQDAAVCEHMCASVCLCVSMRALSPCACVHTRSCHTPYRTQRTMPAVLHVIRGPVSQPGEGRGARPLGESSEERFTSVWTDFFLFVCFWAAFLSDLISPAVMQGVDTVTLQSPSHPASKCLLQRGLEGPASSDPTRSPLPPPGVGPATDNRKPTMPSAHAHLSSASFNEETVLCSVHQTDFITIGLF